MEQGVSFARAVELTSYGEAERLVYAFESVLRKYDIKIAPKTELSRACELLMELQERHKHGSATPWRNLAADLQTSVGMLQIVRLVVAKADHPQFAAIVPHLRLLNDGAVTQNTTAGPRDDANNKQLELLWALALVGLGTDLVLDDPVHSAGGKNPDVLCRLASGLWGFACKMIHGDAPMSLFENLVKGVSQIENSPADLGIVVFNFKNRLPHAALFPTLGRDATGDPILGVHRDVDIVCQQMARWVEDRFTDMISHVTPEQVWAELRGKKALPGAVVVVEAGVGFRTQHGPTPSLLGFLQLVPMQFSPLVLPDPFAAPVMADLRAINDGFQLSPPPR